MTGRGQFDNLKLHLELFRSCDSVVCISREEQWLLSCFGIAADWLPYFPPEKLLAELAEVRRLRRSNISDAVLIVAPLNNPSNRSGLAKVLELWKSIPSAIRPKLTIAGYETEKLKGTAVAGDCTIEGTVGDKRLFELMSTAKGLLIYQHSGSGALTRIPEALVAGIPVICNGIAARSAQHYVGVYQFETAEELAELLSRDLPMPPIPERPVAAEKRFVETVRRVMGLHDSEQLNDTGNRVTMDESTSPKASP
jgi:hypothetical protein